MRISVEWLGDHIDLPVSLEQLQQDLTMNGLIVESIGEQAGSRFLEFEITANRPDCLNHRGIAREIGALYGCRLKAVPSTRKLLAQKELCPLSIEILAPDLCPRYAGLVMTGIRVEPSPEWMQRRLLAAGMRPVNNVVDITNYVLLELGHPLHAFDYRRLRGGRIVVKRAGGGQRFVTLDGVERELDEEMLLICDGEGPVALAGVMGGKDSEISEETDTVLLECAYFSPSSVRRTSKKLGLSTEASYRFERGADWNGTTAAIARTCYLIQKIIRGRIAGSLQDAYPRPLEPVQIDFERRSAETLLGVPLHDPFIVTTLRKLGFRPVKKAQGRWRVQCPTFRPDVQLEADLIEEVARFYGYQRIPVALAPGTGAGIPSPSFQCEEAIRRILLGLGYSEAVSLSFMDRAVSSDFPGLSSAAVSIRNPLTSETELLRTSVIPALVGAARENFNRDCRSIRLYELGKRFISGERGPMELKSLGILGAGSFAGYNWRHSSEDYDFYHLKGAVIALLQGLKSDRVEILPTADIDWLNPADSASLQLGGLRMGVLGSLSPLLCERWKLNTSVYVAEIYLSELMPHLFRTRDFEPLPRYPGVERDLSIVIARGEPYREIEAAVAGLELPELAEMTLMDVYEGRQIPAGKVGMLIRFRFLDREATLTVDRVQGFSDHIRALLRDRFAAEFR